MVWRSSCQGSIPLAMLAVVALLVVAPWAAAASQQGTLGGRRLLQGPADPDVTDRMLVKSTLSNAALAREFGAAGRPLQANASSVRSIGTAGWRSVKLAAPASTRGAERALKARGLDVEMVEPDYQVFATQVVNDPLFSQLYGITKIKSPEAWAITGALAAVTTGNSKKVCVIDTGIRGDHEDLAANMATYNGYQGYDAINNVWRTIMTDSDSHGSHCAGTVAGVGNNGKGVVGVAYNAKLMGCRFLGSNGGTTSDGIECVAKCREMGALITSNSWGGGGFSTALRDEIRRLGEAGGIFIAAAGNENTNRLSYPAAYNQDSTAGRYVLSICASDSRDNRATFSNFGSWVDLCAPGVDIRSTTAGSTTAYSNFSGTSMAAPHASGVAALIAGIGNFSPTEIKDILKATVDKGVGNINTTVCNTGGRLNAFKAVQEAVRRCQAPGSALRCDAAVVGVDFPPLPPSAPPSPSPPPPSPPPPPRPPITTNCLTSGQCNPNAGVNGGCCTGFVCARHNRAQFRCARA